jgi:amidase
MPDVLGDLDATALADLVRSGEVQPAELVDAAIARIEKLDPELNAVIHPRFEAARAEASGALPDGPFRGVPFLLKDISGYSAGDPYHEGMRFLRDAGWRTDADSYVTARFRAGGLVFVGRTNVPELGLIPTTEPFVHGPTRNPWDPSRTAGGSSGGSAAAVAAGMVPAAHATDGGGSIRIPASACGLVGLKPSRGRVSLGPEEDYAGLLNVQGTVTRSVRDTAGLLDIAAGEMPGDPVVAPPPRRPFADEVGAKPGRLRIGLLTRAPAQTAPVHPDCVGAAEQTGRLLEGLGHVVEVDHPPALDELEFTRAFITLWSVGTAFMLEDWGRRVGRAVTADDVEPNTWALAEMGRSASTVQALAAQASLYRWSRRMAEWWAGGFDLLLTPTLAEPPPPLGSFVSPPDNPLGALLRSAAFCPFTPPINVTGQPAISLPLAETAEGLPIGIQLVAPYGREDLLLRVASQLEQAQPWAARRPALHAGN